MRTRDRIATLAIVVTVAASLIALGSAPRWAACMSAFLAIATALPYIASRRTLDHASPLLWFFGLAAGFTALQLVPLPAALTEWIAPGKHALTTANATALAHDTPAFIAVSYDPPATWLELAKLLGYLVFAGTCLRVASSTRGRMSLAVLIASAGAAMAACALLHYGLGMDTLFGVYHPQARPSPYLAPLLNDNHLAGFLACTVPIAIALAISSHGVRRLAWIGASALSAGVSLLVQSRGAAVAMVVGLIVMTFLGWLQHNRKRRGNVRTSRKLQLSQTVPAGIVVLCGVVLLATFTSDGVRDELTGTTTAELTREGSKLGVWQASAELVRDNTWTGVGRGGFEAAFTRVHDSGLDTYSHVENEYLQTLIDWGLPATAILTLILLWLVMVAARRWHRSPLEVGALSSLVVVGLQSSVDFGVELSGFALIVIALASIPLSRNLSRARAHRRRMPFALRIATLLTALVAAAIASSPLASTARDDDHTMTALLVDSAISDQQVIDAGRYAFERHPSDYMLAARLAQAYYYRKRDPRAIALINRALNLNPRHAGLHVFAARMLVAGGRFEQALIEFSLALGYAGEPKSIIDDLVRWFPDPETAARGMPVSRDRFDVLMYRLQTMGHHDIALYYALRCKDAFSSDLDVLGSIFALAMNLGDIELALDASLRLYERRGSDTDVLSRARALRFAGRTEEAIEISTQLIDASKHTDNAPALELYENLAISQLELGRVDLAAQTVHAAIAIGSRDRALVARLYTLLAFAEQARGNERQAQRASKRAHEHRTKKQR